VIKDDRERAGTILYVALRCVDNLKTLFAPFLPFSSQALHELLGHDGHLAGPLLLEEVMEADGAHHTVLTGDYASWCGRWQAGELPAGQALVEPRPLFRKLDPDAVVAEELARMERSASA
jgi:methionyl-tRNA synthetase